MSPGLGSEPRISRWPQVHPAELTELAWKQEVGEEKIITACKGDVVLEKHVTSWGIASLCWEGELVLSLISASPSEGAFLPRLADCFHKTWHVIAHSLFWKFCKLTRVLGAFGETLVLCFCCGVLCCFQVVQWPRGQSLCCFTDLTCQVILSLIKSKVLKFWTAVKWSVSVVNLVTEGLFFFILRRG